MIEAPQHSAHPGGPGLQIVIPLPPGARRRPLGLQAKRTIRQRFLLRTGYHPLSPLVRGRTLRLHPSAPPPDDRKAPGARCGGCEWAQPLDENLPGNLRCWVNNGRRVTRGGATEVRAWWPGCEDWTAESEPDVGAPAR